MKREILIGTMLTALAVGVSAQQPPAQQPPAGNPPSPTQQPAQPRSERPAGDTMTLTGCVAPQSGAPAGAPGAAASASADFILTVMPATGAGAPGAEKPATAGTTGRSNTYKLSAPPDKNLSEFAGKKVEVTGTVNRSGSSSAAGGASAAPTLTVTTIKAAEGTCPK